ncbi:MAG: hypothetical protein ABWY06_18090 [Pseudomonas sp.]
MLITLTLVGGCTGDTYLGELSTQDGAPLRVRDGADGLLKPGTMQVSIETSLWPSDTLTLKHRTGTLQLSVPANAYQGRALALSRHESGLNTDIKAFWTREDLDTYGQTDSVSCTMPGVCLKNVSYRVCPGGTYSQYSKGYQKHAKDEGCVHETRLSDDHFPDCPGSRNVSNTYQRYHYTLKLEFLAPSAAALAEFNGSTGRASYLLRQDSTSSCTSLGSRR